MTREHKGEAEKKSTMAGGWTPFKSLDSNDKKVFNEAMEGHVGVTYTPEKVSKQVVNGTNYRFSCQAKPVTMSGHEYPVIVKIHAPLHGKARIEEIERVVL